MTKSHNEVISAQLDVQKFVNSFCSGHRQTMGSAISDEWSYTQIDGLLDLPDGTIPPELRPVITSMASCCRPLTDDQQEHELATGRLKLMASGLLIGFYLAQQPDAPPK